MTNVSLKWKYALTAAGTLLLMLMCMEWLAVLHLPSVPPRLSWVATLLILALITLAALAYRSGRAYEHALRAARRDRSTLQNVLDSLDDAVLVTSGEGLIQHSNIAARQLLGASESRLLGTPVAQVLRDPQGAEQRVTQLRTCDGENVPVSLKTVQLRTRAPERGGEVLVARDLTPAQSARRHIEHLQSYDALTELPNRVRFQQLLAGALARSKDSSVALLYFDLDHFREVNGTLGPDLGDRVLQDISRRLSACIPAGAVVGRLAGDELAVFIEGVHQGDGHEALIQLSRAALEEIGRVLVIDEHEVFLTASIGIALSPQDGDTGAALIRNADAAMLTAKQDGGNTYTFYAPQMNAEVDQRVMLKGKLRQAIARNELVIRYQPKVDLRDGRIAGAEALLRWRLPDQGEILPARFIPLAEESNLIQDIGFWVLNQVCKDYRQMRDFPGTDHPIDPGRISINLSLRQLRQASFIMCAGSVFQRHAVAPEHLELEITETTLMADGPRTVALLQELAAMGLHLSIDDFGTGYSSLAALRQFPIDTLKIDQSFVRHVSRDEADAAIVRTIIAMGASLGFEVIAEGVESRAQLAFLRDNGCHLAQGRLFGEPLTQEELLALLARQAGGLLPFASLLHAHVPARVG